MKRSRWSCRQFADQAGDRGVNPPRDRLDSSAAHLLAGYQRLPSSSEARREVVEAEAPVTTFGGVWARVLEILPTPSA